MVWPTGLDGFQGQERLWVLLITAELGNKLTRLGFSSRTDKYIYLDFFA
jgi:hypothetical protein